MTSFLSSLSSVIGLTMTMADDNEHRITENDIPFYDLNIHVYDNPAYYGAMGVVEAKINTGDVAFFRKGNLKDFVFKNYTAGSNTTIVCVATVPTEYVKQHM